LIKNKKRKRGKIMLRNIKILMILVILSVFALVFMTVSCAVQAMETEVVQEEVGEAGPPEEVATEAETDEIKVEGLFEARSFATNLTGEAEVQDVDTDATGNAVFILSEDMLSMYFAIYVDGLEDPQAAHIHIGPEGEDGPIIVALFPRGQFTAVSGETISGLLSEGVINAQDLVGPLDGMGIDALVSEILAGNTFVNVHTSEYPPGEIRGQLHTFYTFDPEDVPALEVEEEVEEEMEEENGYRY
jgi:hypothetical protein